VVRGVWQGLSETTSAFLLHVRRKHVSNILRITQNPLVCCDGKTKGVAKGPASGASTVDI